MTTETSSRIESALSQVEEMLRDLTSTDVPLLKQACTHIVSAGGKRLRPRVVFLAYEAAGGDDLSRVTPVAAAVELIHTASLVHDDINDHSEMRRGRATINAQWGDTLALLTGDFIFLKVLDIVAGFDADVTRVLAGACIALVEGETLQTATQSEGQLTEEEYLEVVGRKTASLFSACAELGAIVAGGSSEVRTALSNYGYNFGVAFQLRDDVLDLVGSSQRLGKPVVQDLDQEKMSLAMLHALSESEEAYEILMSKDRDSVLDLLESTGALDYANRRTREYSKAAKEQLAVLVPSAARDALGALTEFAEDREE
ncbi:MAG: polyprenyl synthetase family protein [Candidatus Bipolaricaulota bacterium]